MDETGKPTKHTRRTALRIWLTGSASLTLLAVAGALPIRSILAAPAEQMDDDVVALVRHATKARPKFSVVLALRALRLEQGLREAQQRLIQLQWELAQSRRGLVTSTPSGDDDY